MNKRFVIEAFNYYIKRNKEDYKQIPSAVIKEQVENLEHAKIAYERGHISELEALKIITVWA